MIQIRRSSPILIENQSFQWYEFIQVMTATSDFSALLLSSSSYSAANIVYFGRRQNG